jgi:hypothetical protein
MEPRYFGYLLMRSLPLRCLVVLLSLALVSGNAHARLHVAAAHHEPCPESLDHHHAGTNSSHQGQPRKAVDPACCCDCLGCPSAINLTHELTSAVPAFGAGAVRYGHEDSILAGRVLLPEPDPPRPGTLT